MTGTKLQGVVKFYNESKGFGFITANGKDYFFHVNDCDCEVTAKDKDNSASFEIGESKKGECAKNVKILYS